MDVEGRRLTLLAFVGFTVIAGLNFVAVRFSNRELDPFWGAALRFGAAGLVFLTLALALRRPFPRGRGLVGALLYGVLGFGMSYALAYYGLVAAPAAVGSVAIALAPLMTLFLARAHALETIRARGVLGALVAFAGIALAFWDQLGARVPLLSLVALVLAALAIAESAVVVKRFPRSDPLAMNAVAMLVGAALLSLLSLATGEAWTLPRTNEARLAVTYLVLVGSVVMFFLFLYVIARWSASATSYQTVLSPIVAIVAAALLAGERVGWLFVAGAALVLVGVYLGALRASRPSPSPSPSPSPRA